MAFELPALPYATDALEPHFDKKIGRASCRERVCSTV